MNEQTFKEKIAQILECDPGTISEDSGPATIESWDSMAMLGIIAYLDEVTGGGIAAEEIQSFNSYGAILQHARQRGIVDGTEK